MNAIVDFRSLVQIDHGEPVTTSLRVAEVFGKLHKDVLKAIKNLDCSQEFAQRNFALTYEIKKLGNTERKTPYYEMTKNGFMFLVMGFTGKQAAQFKEKYINAFDWMAEMLIKNGMGKLQRYNYLSLKFTREAMTVSLGAKTMRAWQDSKPELLIELESLERELQPMLGLFEEKQNER